MSVEDLVRLNLDEILAWLRANGTDGMDKLLAEAKAKGPAYERLALDILTSANDAEIGYCRLMHDRYNDYLRATGRESSTTHLGN